MSKRLRGSSLILAIAGIIAAIVFSISAGQFIDLPGFGKDKGGGRTRNALSVVVAGIVASEISPSSTFEMEARKSMYPDSTITGTTSAGSIDSYMPLTFTSSRFRATRKGELFEGTIEKSEFDWIANQTAPGKWSIGRFALKFDYELELTVADGKISGRLYKTFEFDWKIEGTYDEQGNVDIDILVPFGLDVNLVGKVTPAE